MLAFTLFELSICVAEIKKIQYFSFVFVIIYISFTFVFVFFGAILNWIFKWLLYTRQNCSQIHCFTKSFNIKIESFFVIRSFKIPWKRIPKIKYAEQYDHVLLITSHTFVIGRMENERKKNMREHNENGQFNLWKYLYFVHAHDIHIETS